jgi:hypothetical protein
MKSIPLLPHRFKIIGIVLVIPGIILGVLSMYFEYRPDFLTIVTNEHSPFMNTQNFLDEIALTLTLLGLLTISFSREKIEDEFVGQIRLNSLIWSFGLYYLIILLATWVLYNDNFWTLMVYHLFMPIVFYVVLFRINMLRASMSN